MSASLPPPGWHPDPQYPGYQRWWDGTQWSEHRAPLATAPGWHGPALAGFGARLGALIVDGIVVAVPMLLVMGGLVVAMVAGTSATFQDAGTVSTGAELGVGLGFFLLLPVFFLLAYGGQILYSVGFEGGTLGQTPGKWLAGVRVVDARTARPTTPGKAFLRWMVRGFASGTLLVGYLWMLWDAENRTWHDMAADTRVVVADGPRVPLGELLRSWRIRAR